MKEKKIKSKNWRIVTKNICKKIYFNFFKYPQTWKITILNPWQINFLLGNQGNHIMCQF